MTRRDVLRCVHEPFGDAFYYGPERLSARFENDDTARQESGFTDSTFKTIFDRFDTESKEGKRLFIKDMIYYLVPPEGKQPSIAPSLGGKTIKKGVGTPEVNGTKKAPYPFGTEAEPKNPTIIPEEMLRQFHFVFLIRHPRRSIPSYYRCTKPPLDALTGFYDFMPSEAGYDELRRTFDYLRSHGHIGPAQAGRYDDSLPDGEVSITVIDADDLLDHPNEIVEAFCKEVGLDYSDAMLNWDTEEDQKVASDAFSKWNGFHNDAIESTSLKPRSATQKKKAKTTDDEDQEWAKKYGPEGRKIIRDCVDENVADYEYLKAFAIQV
ncbi:MAG: hypothetical protein M1818_007206 [Claussenomyces sp. TS43310]|nr:MAG: hypothetical protein M1818_007206 [Claussenomyces sp. TS43310]